MNQRVYAITFSAVFFFLSQKNGAGFGSCTRAHTHDEMRSDVIITFEMLIK